MVLIFPIKRGIFLRRMGNGCPLRLRPKKENSVRKELEGMIHDFGKIPIVSMSLVDKLCEKELLDYFEKKKFSMLHIILEAKRETIISRIENDPIRKEDNQNQQKSKVFWQMQYLETEYLNAVRINTEDKTLDEIVGEIMALL